ncbi:hypothetical protein FB480_103357 [Agrobacterium vitis]|nr:hypothetical protein FB480_103357 [Agrobacterium vitis]
MGAFFSLKRLRITSGKEVAYDENFHQGVNIIRGENSTGKSTISDFIFYVLGGEFDRWKDAAKQCTAVRAEIETKESIITAHRAVGRAQEPILIFYGSLEESLGKGIDEWQRVNIRRISGSPELSFTQILFRAAGIPEAPNIDNSNITMHQLLRLLYADQQTPPGKLFRFESFDTKEIRETVGQLVIGFNGYDLYDALIEFRQEKKEYDQLDTAYEAAIHALPSSESLKSVSALDAKIDQISLQIKKINEEVQNVDSLITEDQSKEFFAEQIKMRKRVRKRSQVYQLKESVLSDLVDEQIEIKQFIEFLEGQLIALNADQNLSEKIGIIEFQYCPSCLQKLKYKKEKHCIVCNEIVDEEKERSKYFELKVDCELQLRESKQLQQEKAAKIASLESEVRALRREYSKAATEFAVRYDITNSPRESFLAERYKLLGSLDREAGYLEEFRAALKHIDDLSAKRAAKNGDVERLKAKIERLKATSNARLENAMNSINAIGTRILKSDTKREDTFKDPKVFTINFADDAMMVDGKMNFAESSNVVLKNTAILSLLLAACYDKKFWHPKFLLMDNIEDKGLELKRGHNYQNIIIRESQKAPFPHQIIFTTSELDPALEDSDLTVGPRYTADNKTLKNIHVSSEENP